jgi:DNA-directed RNA polymerase subunit RPC12/RpoP
MVHFSINYAASLDEALFAHVLAGCLFVFGLLAAGMFVYAPRTLQECPDCGQEFVGSPVVSRKDNETEICPHCGEREAILACITAGWQLERAWKQMQEEEESGVIFSHLMPPKCARMAEWVCSPQRKEPGFASERLLLRARLC